MRSVFVFFAVFMFLFCSMNSPVLASFNTSALGEETLSLSLPVKFLKIVVESGKEVNSHNPRMRMLRKCRPFFSLLIEKHTQVRSTFQTGILQYKITNCPNNRTISRDICTPFERYLYSACCSWIIITDISEGDGGKKLREKR